MVLNKENNNYSIFVKSIEKKSETINTNLRLIGSHLRQIKQ
jgi:hypothetical protein